MFDIRAKMFEGPYVWAARSLPDESEAVGEARRLKEFYSMVKVIERATGRVALKLADEGYTRRRVVARIR